MSRLSFTRATLAIATVLGAAACGSGASEARTSNQRLFVDVHQLGPGKVTAAAVAEAHRKDLAVQGKHAVSFTRYWVDEENGLVYCLAAAPDANAVVAAHREAHGLIPDEVHQVVEGR